MSAANLDLTIEQGATFSIPITVKVFQNGQYVPFDLTGYTAKAQIRLTPSTPDPSLAEFQISGTFDANGTFVISLSAIQTAALPVNVLVYDLFIISGAIQTKLIAGDANVIARVTV